VNGVVVAVGGSPAHTFHEPVRDHIRLLAGLGADADARAGVTVKHRSRSGRATRSGSNCRRSRTARWTRCESAQPIALRNSSNR
jgi:hypothetical protein